jgi:ppGpp synthetase/RelA/SpoT-type nucleotidyltranferase
MKLSQMQDIAGCRAILGTVDGVEQLVHAYKHSEIKHKLVHEDNYIETPKASGYRSHHLIYRYYSDALRCTTA